VHEKGINALEDLMFDEDLLVRRAGTEAMCNMFFSEEVRWFSSRDRHG
jgi:hypothetical protein